MIAIVAYDVPQGRTRIFRNLLRKYLHHIQDSVFRGELSPSKLAELKQEIDSAATKNDKIHIFEIERKTNISTTTYGNIKPNDKFST